MAGLMIGLDTGFFIELMDGNEEAISLWKSGLDDEVEFAVSALSLFEIERLGLKGKLKESDAVLDAINGVTSVVWLDSEIFSRAAGLSHGLGIPAMDSLILTSLITNGCTEIYTTDSHLQAYQSNKVIVRNLRKPEKQAQ
jgi:predicted nucleic acid-binding protein